MTPHIHTCLWFDTQAEEAAGFYTALFPNSRITSVLRYGTGDPMPEGTVQMWRVVADRAAVRPGVHAGSAQPGQAAHDHRSRETPMTTLHFEILIQAQREHVWRTMLHPPTYGQWTATFCEGSRFEGSWDECQTIRFYGPDGQGMVSVVDKHRPAEFLSIRHLGMIENGVEDTSSDAVRAWAPCFENYTFTDEAGGTRVRVDVDVFGTHEDWMNEAWPKALLALKAVCETPT